MDPKPARATPRIAFVSSLVLGGASTFLCNLAGELGKRRIPTIIVSPERDNAFASDFQRAGVKVFLHDHRRMIFEDRMNAMLRILAGFQPTAVVACLGQSSYEVLRYLPAGVRRLAVIQADAPMFYHAAVPYADCLDNIVGISGKITERLEQMDVFRNVSKLCLLHGVAVPPAVKPRATGGEPLRVLYLGRIMNPQKRVHLFPKILQELQKAGIPFRWTIAGEGEERAALECAMASNEPEQQIVFPGPLPNADAPALLEKHDIFLLASDAEGLPISLLEAMANGLVPVVSDLESGIREVVDESNGMLVPVDDTMGYARAIIHLHKHRDELAAKSAAARERVKKEFSVEAMADRWLTVFPQVISAVKWPSRWRVNAPLAVRHPLYFSLPIRPLRRLAARFRK